MKNYFLSTHVFRLSITYLTDITMNLNVIKLSNKSDIFDLCKSLYFLYFLEDRLQYESVVNYTQFNNENHIRYNLTNKTNIHCINNKNIMIKLHNRI